MVTGLALDSRKVQSGDLFLAVAGTQTHGLQHARQAIALGAVAVAWEPVAAMSGLAETAALLPVPVVAIPGLWSGDRVDRGPLLRAPVARPVHDRRDRYRRQDILQPFHRPGAGQRGPSLRSDRHAGLRAVR